MNAATNNHAAPLSILVVDDDRFTLELMREMLHAVGHFDVLTENDGSRALLLLDERRPDLLICDLSMPGMDGIEFLHEAAKARYMGSVMLLSGVDGGVRMAAERLARVEGLRVLGAWRKPIELAELRAAIEALLASRVALANRKQAVAPIDDFDV